MAIGDQNDMVSRLKAVLPRRWFADTTPVLDVVLSGCANAWAWVYALTCWLRAQIRIVTATGIILDLMALDYFGQRIARFPNESDQVFRARIIANLLPERGTRRGVSLALEVLTGRAPVIFEPANTGDTGGYGAGEARTWSGMAYGARGGWGSLALPFQAFIQAYRPHAGGIASVGGYYSGSGWDGGGYGAGAIQYIGGDMIAAQVSDAAIYQTIADAAAAGTIMWTNISS